MADPFSVSVVGLGLMGGSLALALRRTQMSNLRVTGVDLNRDTLEAALAQEAIVTGTTDLARGVADADVIVLATPVRSILRLLPEVGRYARPGALVMDLGSTKTQICETMDALPDHLGAVGGHPMCGKEVAGFEAADAYLFEQRPFVLCPTARTRDTGLDLARRLALAAGARPVVMDAPAHDRAVAAISHLPYAVAVTLVDAVAANAGTAAWSLAASGFRDTSRLASSNVEVMLDTLLTNRDAVLDWIAVFGEHLAGLQQALAEGDESTLRARLHAASAWRAAQIR